MGSWKARAERLKFDEGKSWSEVAEGIKCYFPQLNTQQVVEKARMYLRRHPRYKAQAVEPERHSVEMKKDGSYEYDRLIEIAENEEMTPEFLLSAHGLDNKRWKIISYKNNYWHSQVKGGKRLLMYQSKLVVKPYADDEISLPEVQEWFADFELSYKPPKVNIIKPTASQLLEVNIADLHFGKMAWHGECGEDYDYKIATERYNYIIDDIISRVDHKRVEQIVMPLGNDFFNSDTVSATTTKGTVQTNDLRWRKMFKLGLELIIGGIDKFSQIAPVKAFCVSANHDEMASFYATCAIQSHFRNYSNVIIDTSGEPRHYIEYYNTLIGFSHGDEDKPRIQKLMQVEAREAWGRTIFHEMHTAHLHSENVKEDGGLIWRTTSSVTGTDYWHKKVGFVGAIKKSQSFIYDREKGLTDILNSVL